MPAYTFEIYGSSASYSCTRVVAGDAFLRQTVTVEGIGTREDPDEYYLLDKDVQWVMDARAKFIACEIIEAHLRQS